MDMMTAKFKEDVRNAKAMLSRLPRDWEAREALLAMHGLCQDRAEREWLQSYFSSLSVRMLARVMFLPRESGDSAIPDLRRQVNWASRAIALNSDGGYIHFNDKAEIDAALEADGEHGIILALCDVEYAERTSPVRYRKDRAQLTEVLFLRVSTENVSLLGTMKQGRNSNDAPRAEKYMLDLDMVGDFLVDRLEFDSPSAVVESDDTE